MTSSAAALTDDSKVADRNERCTANGRADQSTCPGCGSDAFLVVGPPGPELTVNLHGSKYLQPTYDARRCRQCQLVFKSAIASPEVLAEYYSRVDYRKWEIPGLFPTEEAVLSVLDTLHPTSRVLDFGCSTGRLLSRVTGRLTCFGFEINSSAASEAARKGLRMLSEEELFATDSGPRFDAITAVDLVEHLTSPTAVLTKLAHCLAPGGLLVLSTGDADSPAARKDPANFWYFRTIEHVCMMTRGYVEFLAARLGMELVRWDRMSHYRQSVATRVVECARTFVFEVFHRDRAPWIRPLVAVTPVLRRAKNWNERPAQVGTADHALVVLRKR